MTESASDRRRWAPAGEAQSWSPPALAERLSDLVTGSRTLEQLVSLAVTLLDSATAQVSLITEEQRIASAAGAGAASTGTRMVASDSFCAITAGTGAPFVVTDAGADPRVRDVPAVRAGAVGSYLGVPLTVRGQVVGALCVHGPETRDWAPADTATLEKLAAPVTAELESALAAAEHESERILWQLAVDAAEVGAFDWNLVTGDLRWDDRLLVVFGLDHDSFGGTIEAFNAMVHVDDRDRVGDALDAAIRSCGVYSAEYRIVRPDGQTRWVAAKGRALPGPDGVAQRVLGAAFDTTAVQEGEARVGRVLEAMPAAFFDLDRNWRFTYLNSEGQRLLGPIGGEILGSVIWELFPDAVGSNFEVQYRRAMSSGEPVEFEAYYPPPLDRWYDVRAWPTPDGLSVYFNDVTARRAAELASRRDAERAVMRATITGRLSGRLDPEEICTALARAVAGPLGCWSIVTLADEPDELAGEAALAPGWRRGFRDVAAWHTDVEHRAAVDRYRALRLEALTEGSFVAAALTGDDPVLIEDGAAERIAEVLAPGEARDLCLALAPDGALVVPLRGRGRTVGLLTLFRGPGRERFTAEDVADVTEVAGRAGLALDNAVLYRQQATVAAELQRNLLTPPPQPGHLHVVVRYEPASKAARVGGDWYDAFLQPDGATNIVIGDVAGHDISAAAAMGQLRSLLRGIAVATNADPAAVLRLVDEAMETLQVPTIATAVVARFEQTDAEREQGDTRLRWANAGHPPPLVAVRDGQVRVLRAEAADLLLGFDSGVPRTENVLTLRQGSTVLLYTDGLVERRGQSLDDGIDRLEQTFGELIGQRLDLEALCDQLLARMLPENKEDDVALVAVRLHPQDRPRPAEAGPERIPPTVRAGKASS